MFTVEFSEEALEDFETALEYYRDISFELGNKFTSNFDESASQLENIPFFQIRYDEMRLRKIKNFPIIIHFTISTNKIVIVHGVRFAQQNPENYPKP